MSAEQTPCDDCGKTPTTTTFNGTLNDKEGTWRLCDGCADDVESSSDEEKPTPIPFSDEHAKEWDNFACPKGGVATIEGVLQEEIDNPTLGKKRKGEEVWEDEFSSPEKLLKYAKSLADEMVKTENAKVTAMDKVATALHGINDKLSVISNALIIHAGPEHKFTGGAVDQYKYNGLASKAFTQLCSQ